MATGEEILLKLLFRRNRCKQVRNFSSEIKSSLLDTIETFDLFYHLMMGFIRRRAKMLSR